MKIAMFTNTYLPHVGGVARSVKTLEDACRARGHEVRVIAPEAEGEETTSEVLRVPAILNFNGSDFAVRLPIPALVRDFMEDFQPDIIHSHHPFLLGDAALREAWKSRLPIVFTHHTLYERYTHYVPLDSPGMKRAAIEIATGYCNLCDLVIAPSESIARLLVEREVTTPVTVVPTGIDANGFGSGCGQRFRERHGIPADAVVIGHVGRLAEEKNLSFLAKAVAACLEKAPNANFLVVGGGESLDPMLSILSAQVKAGRVHQPGKLAGADLIDAYAAIDCFAFTSQSETQGMVLAEAMAAGAPVVALDGPGVREIVRNGGNGILLAGNASVDEFVRALSSMINDAGFRESCAAKARETALEFDTAPCVEKVLQVYQDVISRREEQHEEDPTQWERLLAGIEIEWDLLSAKVSAAAAAITEPPAKEAALD